MTAHVSNAVRPIRRPARTEPTRPVSRPLRAAILLAAATLAAASVWSLATSPRLANAAHHVCTVGEPAGTTCAEALVHVGYPS